MPLSLHRTISSGIGPLPYTPGQVKPQVGDEERSTKYYMYGKKYNTLHYTTVQHDTIQYGTTQYSTTQLRDFRPLDDSCPGPLTLLRLWLSSPAPFLDPPTFQSPPMWTLPWALEDYTSISFLLLGGSCLFGLIEETRL